MAYTVLALAALILVGCGSPTEPTGYFYLGVGGPELRTACSTEGLYFATLEQPGGFTRSPLVDPGGSAWADVCCTPVDHGFHWNVGGERFGEASIAVKLGDGACL